MQLLARYDNHAPSAFPVSPKIGYERTPSLSETTRLSSRRLALYPLLALMLSGFLWMFSDTLQPLSMNIVNLGKTQNYVVNPPSAWKGDDFTEISRKRDLTHEQCNINFKGLFEETARARDYVRMITLIQRLLADNVQLQWKTHGGITREILGDAAALRAQMQIAIVNNQLYLANHTLHEDMSDYTKSTLASIREHILIVEYTDSSS